MITSVDTNVLIDILDNDPRFFASSVKAVSDAQLVGPTVVCEVVVAELAANFDDERSLATFLDDLGITVWSANLAALALAGRAWTAYRRNRATTTSCPNCGAIQEVVCMQCSEALTARTRLVADFVVGAHAMVHATRLITRDSRFYRTYFPGLALN